MKSTANTQAIVAEQLSLTFSRFLDLRLFVLPFIITVALIVAWLDPAGWRRSMLLALLVISLAVSLFERWRFARFGISRLTVPINLLLVAVGQPLIVFSTGALESPVLVGLALGAVANGLLLERRLAAVALLTQILAIWTMVVGQLLGWFPDARLQTLSATRTGELNPVFWVVTAATVSVLLAATTSVSHLARTTARNVLLRLNRSREEMLREHTEHTRDLEMLSAEIAHELKNPLATVKGLAALIERNGHDGKSSERMRVLRREVDRMQDVLEDFLNFSRPLVPLNLQEVAIDELCQDVVALHQGVAGERDVHLEVEVHDHERVLCDPRKVKQILMNLLLNAVDASPVGSRIVVSARRTSEEQIVIAVEDTGAGLDPAVAERVFDSGVSTKPKGSGLGLTIARALARQHGGEVTLRGVPHGCRAELRLPLGRT